MTAALVTSVDDWSAVLDSLQSHVDAAEHLTTRDTSLLIPAWEPPRVSGSPTAAQVERATALVGRLRALTTKVERAAVAVQHEMDFVRSASTRMSRSPSKFIDAIL
jgi:hypothetical protein